MNAKKSFQSKFVSFLKRCANVIFPQNCLGCGKNDVILCEDCLTTLPQTERNTYLDKSTITACFDYKNTLVKKIIWSLKYKGARDLARPLAEALYDQLLKMVLQ